MEVPENQDFRVTVERANGDVIVEFMGWTQTVTDAIYKTLEVWEEKYQKLVAQED